MESSINYDRKTSRSKVIFRAGERLHVSTSRFPVQSADALLASAAEIAGLPEPFCSPQPG